jgi:hypothetical protein
MDGKYNPLLIFLKKEKDLELGFLNMKFKFRIKKT